MTSCFLEEVDEVAELGFLASHARLHGECTVMTNEVIAIVWGLDLLQFLSEGREGFFELLPMEEEELRWTCQIQFHSSWGHQDGMLGKWQRRAKLVKIG